jgi:hypothetical protein
MTLASSEMGGRRGRASDKLASHKQSHSGIYRTHAEIFKLAPFNDLPQMMKANGDDGESIDISALLLPLTPRMMSVGVLHMNATETARRLARAILELDADPIDLGDAAMLVLLNLIHAKGAIPQRA